MRAWGGQGPRKRERERNKPHKSDFFLLPKKMKHMIAALIKQRQGLTRGKCGARSGGRCGDNAALAISWRAVVPTPGEGRGGGVEEGERKILWYGCLRARARIHTHMRVLPSCPGHRGPPPLSWRLGVLKGGRTVSQLQRSMAPPPGSEGGGLGGMGGSARARNAANCEPKLGGRQQLSPRTTWPLGSSVERGSFSSRLMENPAAAGAQLLRLVTPEKTRRRWNPKSANENQSELRWRRTTAMERRAPQTSARRLCPSLPCCNAGVGAAKMD